MCRIVSYFTIPNSDLCYEEYSAIKGIAGNAIGSIKTLDLPYTNDLLEE